jgi:DNA-binding Lrp family transcriptional regulator
MASENFLLVSLEENKAKQLAQIVSNDVCRKILDFLSSKEKGATETEVSKKLEIPLSTTHYNIKQLEKSGIVKAEEFHYSEKGKEVLHYSLANKYIIIAPKATESLAKKLKGILPVAAFVAATGVAIQFFKEGFSNVVPQATVRSFAEADSLAKPAAEELARTATGATLPGAMDAAAIVEPVIRSEPNIAMWFAIGALFSLIVYLIYDIIRERMK